MRDHSSENDFQACFEDENLFFQIIGRHFCKATTTYRLLQTKNKNAPGQDPSYLD